MAEHPAAAVEDAITSRRSIRAFLPDAIARATVERLLAIPEREMIICGMALGYADESHPINRLVTERAAVGEFATFEGFGD